MRMVENVGQARAGARYKRHLAAVTALVGAFFVVELVGGLLTNSLALLSDAGHMLTDVVGLGMALAAIHVADRYGTGSQRTFGLYRLEILAALANATLLFVVAGYVLFEAWQRFSDPPEVAAGPMLAVAVAGLAVNLVSFLLLRRGAGESINVEGAYLEVLADTLGSVGVVVAGTLVAVTGWQAVDPAFGAGIGVFILPRTWRLGAKALRILVQVAPPHVDVGRLHSDLSAIDDVVDVHDVHVWTLTSEMEVGSAHLVVRDGSDAHGVLDRAREILRDEHHVEHATLQVEPEDHHGCQEIHW